MHRCGWFGGVAANYNVLLKQLSCASDGKIREIDSIKMHVTTVKIRSVRLIRLWFTLFKETGNMLKENQQAAFAFWETVSNSMGHV